MKHFKINVKGIAFIDLMMVGAIFLLLYPYMISGFFFDDIYNSTLKGYLHANNINFLQHVENELIKWFDHGRLFPLSIIYGSASWYFFDTLALMKVYQISITIFNIFLFYKLLLTVTEDKKYSTLVIIILACSIQFNPRWDGLTSFHALNQITLIFITSSALMLLRSMVEVNSHKLKLYVWASFILSVFALLSYEIGLVTLFLNILILFFYRNKFQNYKILTGLFLIVGAIYFLVNVILRFMQSGIYDGVGFSISVNLFPTFLNQLFSAFPLAFLGNRVLNTPAVYPVSFIVVSLFFLIFLYKIFFVENTVLQLVHRKKSCAPHSLHIYLALILLTLPPLLISMSGKYQNIVSFGDPYIIVYIQFFGVSMLLAELIRRFVLNRPSVYPKLISLLAISFVASFTINVNYEKIVIMNEKFKQPRIESEKILGSQFMDGVGNDATVIVDSQSLWDADGIPPKNLCTAFFTLHLKRNIYCIGLQSYLSDEIVHKNLLGVNNLFFLKRSYQGISGALWEMQGGGIKKVAKYDAIDDEVLVESIESNAIEFYQLGEGFYGWESDGNEAFAWAGGSSVINLFNLSNTSRLVSLDFVLISAVNQYILVQFNDGADIKKWAGAGEMIAINVGGELHFGKNEVKIRVDGPVMKVAGDPREFSFQIRSLNLK